MEEIFEDIEIRGDKKSRRWMLTFNNPLWETNFKEVNPQESFLPFDDAKHNLSYVLRPENAKFFEFHNVEFQHRNKKGEVTDEYVCERCYFKSEKEVLEYVKGFTNLAYCIFQFEIGKEGTLHIQGFFRFSKPKSFSTMRSYFPFGHVDLPYGGDYVPSEDLRDYCSKIYDEKNKQGKYVTREEDKDENCLNVTRLDGPYSYGTFVEGRERIDLKDFKEMLEQGLSNEEIRTQAPSLYFRFRPKGLLEMKQDILGESLKKNKRDVFVTYVYGVSRMGKSTMTIDDLGFENVFVPDWEKGRQFYFEGYNGEKIITLDEFEGQIPITSMNKLLEGRPHRFNVKGGSCWAQHAQVFIVANMPLEQQYLGKEERDKNPLAFLAFKERIHKIIRFTGKAWGDYVVEKDVTKRVEKAEQLTLITDPKEIENLERCFNDESSEQAKTS